MIDSNLVLFNGALTETQTGATKDLGPTLVNETYLIYVPSASGTTPKIVAAIEESADDSVWTRKTSQEITAAGEYYETVVSNMRYRRVVLTVSGTTPDFGTVLVARVPAGHYNKF